MKPYVGEAQTASELASLAQVEGLFGLIPDAAIVIDDAGRIVALNVLAVEMFGYPLQALLGQPIEILIPEALRNRHVRHRTRFSDEPRLRPMGADLDLHALRADGTTFPVDIMLKPLSITGRRYVLGVIRDVTERQQVERQLRRNEAMFHGLFEYSPDAVVVIQADGTISRVNAQTERLFGYGRADLLGQPVEILLPVRYRNRHVGHRRGYAVEPRTRPMGEGLELFGLRRDGQEFPIDILLSPMQTEEGALVLSVIRDITERKRAEENLRRAREDLEARVEERTRELTQMNATLRAEIIERERLEEALRWKNEELAAEDRRKDEFLAMLAHELRNPLAPILTSVHLMRASGEASPALQRARDVVERQSKHMARLVDDLLDASRFSQGKIALRPERISLTTLVDNAVETCRPLINVRGHRLSVMVERDPVLLEVDPTRLEQVITNLLTNAAKFTDPGGAITLTAGREGTEAVLRVRDTGQGIAPELLPHIFDLFAQADTSLDRAQGGLGIGLTLVKSIIDLHGGSVSAHSAGLGRGTEFEVRLPALDAIEIVPSPTPASLSRSDEAELHILIVDDNRDAAESLAALVQLWNHRTLSAYDGPTALEVALSHRPEVVLLDIGLPGMDGFEVARHLRAVVGPAEMVLVAITGYGKEEDRERAARAGFQHYLVKPVEPGPLHVLLAECRAGPSGSSARSGSDPFR